MSFLRCVLEKAKGLTGYSQYMWWFPRKMQVIFERLFAGKPLESDVGGLLGLIMFAGIEEEESGTGNLNIAAMIEKAYLPRNKKNISNLLFDSQQNMSALMFGITVDNVSKQCCTLRTFTDTNSYLFSQRTRFLERVNECCMNPKSL
jgi:hypothetical protein